MTPAEQARLLVRKAAQDLAALERLLGDPAIEAATLGFHAQQAAVLEGRLRSALTRLNPGLPAESLEEAFRKLIRLDAPSLIEKNRAAHRFLVDGIPVEFRRLDGSIGGAQVRREKDSSGVTLKDHQERAATAASGDVED